MIVKFLSTRNGGGSGSIDYALNQKRIENGTARVLKGDERMTRELVATITKKQKTSFAVMSFEEENIPEEQKRELMTAFEQTFFAGLRPDQYNVLWVEHTDKGRLELNAIIPKIELSTGKAYNPYNHKTDLHIKDLFTKSVNLKYGFTDPNDPAKTATVSGSKKQIRLFKNYEELDQKLKHLVADGAIQDRTELIEMLKENGIEVTRAGTDYISVKLPESKKARRLNGGIYTDEFTSIDELRDIREKQTQRERAFASRDRQEEYRAVTQRFSTALAKRAQYNAELYREPPKRKRATQERVAERARELQIVPKENNRSSQQRQSEAKGRQGGASREQRENREIRKQIPMGLDYGEVENDRIRSAAAEYVRGREERERARARRSSERTQNVARCNRIIERTESTDYRAIEQAVRGRQLRSYLAEGVKRLPRFLDRVTHSIVEGIKELTKPIDRELEQIRAMFGKTDTRGKGLIEAVQELKKQQSSGLNL